MGRSRSQVLIYKRYKVIVTNTFIIVPQGEVGESDSVRLFKVLETAVPKLGLLWSSIEGLLERGGLYEKVSCVP